MHVVKGPSKKHHSLLILGADYNSVNMSNPPSTQQPSPQQPSPQQPSPPVSKGTLWIAILLISAFILFTGIIIFYNYNAKNGLPIEDIEKVGAIWGPWVGAILGYFFGSRSSESLAEENKNLSRETGKKDQKLIHNKELMLRYRNNIDDNILKVTQNRSDATQKGIVSTNLQPLDEVLDDLKNARDRLDEAIDSM